MKPKNEQLIEILFDDMKKMDSVIKRLQEEINDVRTKTENVPKDMKMMDSVIRKLQRKISELEARVRDGKNTRWSTQKDSKSL